MKKNTHRRNYGKEQALCDRPAIVSTHGQEARDVSHALSGYKPRHQPIVDALKPFCHSTLFPSPTSPSTPNLWAR
jgi:hypothetical protein